MLDLTKAQIFNYASTFPQTNHMKVSYPFSLTVSAFLHHFVLEVMNRKDQHKISKHSVGTFCIHKI